MLGATNYFYDTLDAILSQITLKMHAVDWARSCNLVRDSHYGGTVVFNGPACRTLLHNLNKLVGLLMHNSLLGRCKPILDVFEKFKNVVQSCFGNVLYPRYANDIREFAGAFFNLINFCDELSTPENRIKVNVIPKIHIIFLHIIHFIEQQKENHNVEFGLGFYSAQWYESS